MLRKKNSRLCITSRLYTVKTIYIAHVHTHLHTQLHVQSYTHIHTRAHAQTHRLL